MTNLFEKFFLNVFSENQTFDNNYLIIFVKKITIVSAEIIKFDDCSTGMEKSRKTKREGIKAFRRSI